MPFIAARQVEALLLGMELIDQAEEAWEIPQLFADGCARAIACANVSFNLIDRRLAGLHVARSRGVQIPAEEDSPLLRNLSEHPMIMRILRDNSKAVMEFSDFYTRRMFHRTRLYNEYYRRSDTQRQLCFQVGRSPDDCAVLAINHVSGSDFSPEDRATAAILQRHAATVYRRVALLGRAQKVVCGMEAVLRSSGLVPLVLDRCYRPVSCSDEGFTLLQRFFGEGLSFRGALPPTLVRWLRVCGDRASSIESRLYEPLLVEGSAGVLEITFRAGSERLLPMILLRELPSKGVSRFRALERLGSLGLTSRESEVLFWIAEGKTNPEIAILLNISPRTVHKHVEHIFGKLRVENRQAALLRARTEIGSGSWTSGVSG